MDSHRTEFPSIYHINCEVLINQGKSRCECCKRHRKSLCALASRHERSKLADACTSDHSSGTSGSVKFMNNTDSMEKDQPLDLSSCLPIESCTDSTMLDTVMELHDGLKGNGDIPSGMEKCNIM